MSNLIMHFEIPADDVARAKRFYEKTFGWKIMAFPMPPGQEYFGVTTKKPDEPGINGGLMQRKVPGQPFTTYITVKSIDAMLQKILANGGVVAVPKQAIGRGMGWISAFMDQENNLIGLHQSPPAPEKKAPATKALAKKKLAKQAKKKTDK